MISSLNKLLGESWTSSDGDSWTEISTRLAEVKSVYDKLIYLYPAMGTGKEKKTWDAKLSTLKMQEDY